MIDAAAAHGATPAPGWSIHTLAAPTVFSASDNKNTTCSESTEFVGCDHYQVTVTNAGDEPSFGTPVVIEDKPPPGLTIDRIALFSSEFPGFDLGSICSKTPLRCEFSFSPMAPDATLRMVVYVSVPSEVGTLTNTAEVSGGGASTKKVTTTNQLGGPPPAFGAADFEAFFAGPNGEPETQAGAHPYEFRTRIDFNNAFGVMPDANFGITSVEDPKDVVVDLPVGVLGSATATPTCTFAQLSSHISGGVGGCPSNTIIGHIFTEPVTGESVQGPIYNMKPERGQAAEFGFVDLLAGPHVIYSHVVPTSAGYTLRAIAPELPQVPLTDVITTFYGDPAAKEEERTHTKSVLPPNAFFTTPSDCSGQPLTTTVHIDSWQSPGRMTSEGSPDLSDSHWASASSSMPPVTGCNRLRFDAAFSLQPDTSVADSPTGAEVHIDVPQSEEYGALATPPLRNAVVTLPPGLTVDPSAAQGLGACAPSQIDLQSPAQPACPENSKIGTVNVTTPLVPGVLQGAVYLATQYANPFGSLLAAYVVIDDPETGIVAKIPGKLEPNASTGQITATFENAPQFPFSDLTMNFKGGARGVLATPESCGTFSVSSVLSPWSAPFSGPDASPTSTFGIGSGCVAGFAPTFSAGTASPQAGAYSPFVMSFARSDTDQELSSATVRLPAGLLAKIAGVERCSDAQVAQAAANASGLAEQASPSCPAGSQVGTVQAGAGPGPNPLFVSGKVYLTGPYKHAPYGLAIVVPAVAGPYDLGDVVVRAALYIDPTDGHVTAVSDPFPTIVNQTGIPVRLRRVDVAIDRSSFTFNPTSCAQKTISATLGSVQGATTTTSDRFQAGGCRELSFAPTFAASTQAKTSRLNGASLTVKVTAKPGDANIGKVNVQLPEQLPSRLPTLQKACTERQFVADPAGCPGASNVGTAIADTPILNVPLTGPAYLVSHGGAAFPDLEFVLQAEGVTIVLDGKTDIKKGITYSRFESVPDAPISSFTATFPEGPHSILGAFGSLCNPTKIVVQRRSVKVRRHGHVHTVVRKVKRTVLEPLKMPTTITGQNGAIVTQDTAIRVLGCSTHKGSHGTRKGHHRRRRG
jgi:hypothetical protein